MAKTSYIRDILEAIPEEIDLALQGNGHYAALYQGRRIAGFSASPSSPRTRPNELARFWRAWDFIHNRDLQARLQAVLEALQNGDELVREQRGKRAFYRLRKSKMPVATAVAEQVFNAQGLTVVEIPDIEKPEILIITKAPERDPLLEQFVAFQQDLDEMVAKHEAELKALKDRLSVFLNELYAGVQSRNGLP